MNATNLAVFKPKKLQQLSTSSAFDTKGNDEPSVVWGDGFAERAVMQSIGKIEAQVF